MKTLAHGRDLIRIFTRALVTNSGEEVFDELQWTLQSYIRDSLSEIEEIDEFKLPLNSLPNHLPEYFLEIYEARITRSRKLHDQVRELKKRFKLLEQNRFIEKTWSLIDVRKTLLFANEFLEMKIENDAFSKRFDKILELILEAEIMKDRRMQEKLTATLVSFATMAITPIPGYEFVWAAQKAYEWWSDSLAKQHVTLKRWSLSDSKTRDDFVEFLSKLKHSTDTEFFPRDRMVLLHNSTSRYISVYVQSIFPQDEVEFCENVQAADCEAEEFFFRQMNLEKRRLEKFPVVGSLVRLVPSEESVTKSEMLLSPAGTKLLELPKKFRRRVKIKFSHSLERFLLFLNRETLQLEDDVVEEHILLKRGSELLNLEVPGVPWISKVFHSEKEKILTILNHVEKRRDLPVTLEVFEDSKNWTARFTYTVENVFVGFATFDNNDVVSIVNLAQRVEVEDGDEGIVLENTLHEDCEITIFSLTSDDGLLDVAEKKQIYFTKLRSRQKLRLEENFLKNSGCTRVRVKFLASFEETADLNLKTLCRIV